MKFLKLYILLIYALDNLVQKTFQQIQVLQSDRVLIVKEQQVWQSTSISPNSYADYTIDLTAGQFKSVPKILYALTVYNADDENQQGFMIGTMNLSQTSLKYRLRSLGSTLAQIAFNVLAIDDPNVEVQQIQLMSGATSVITGTKPIQQIAGFIYGFQGTDSNNMVIRYNLIKVDSMNYQIKFSNTNIQSVYMNFLIVYQNTSDMFQQLYGYQMAFDTIGRNIGGDNTVSWTTTSILDRSNIFFGLKDFSISSNDFYGIKILSGQNPEAQNKQVKLNYFTWNGYYVNMINGIWVGLSLVNCQTGSTLFVNSTYYACVSQCNTVDHHYNNNPSNTYNLYKSTISYCQQCNSNCYGCLNGQPNVCTDCYNNQYLNPTTKACDAVQPPKTVCPLTTVSGQSFYNCQSCHSTCMQCSSPMSSNSCTSCDISSSNKYFYNNSCLTSQPSKTYCDSNFICQNCDSTCLKCSAPSNSSACTQCDVTSANKYFYNNQCFPSKPSSTFCDSNFICQKCDQTCGECVSPGNATSCTSCNINSTYKYFYNNQCFSSKPSSTFCDSNFICQKCNQTCGECISPGNATSCTSCDITSLNKYLYNNQCLPSKPSSTFCDSNFVCQKCDLTCAECVAPGNATSCTSCNISSSNKYFYNNQCMISKPSSTFCDSNFICQKCDQTCGECVSPGNATSCTSCDINSTYKYFYNNQCFSDVPPGTYCDNNFICQKCDPSCKTCLNTATNCTSCIDVKYLDHGTCLCLPGYFMDNLGNCNSCANNCLQCYNPQTCNKCVINYVLSSDYTTCICTIPNCQKCNKSDGSICDTCNNGFTSQYNNKICQCDSQNCLSCDPSNGNICQKCEQNYILNQSSQCECSVQNCSKCNEKDGAICDSCINGYISMDNNITCKCSIYNCQQCDPNNGNICLKCQPNYILNSSQNQCSCSVPYCQTCNANDGSICDACQDGFSYQSTSKLCAVEQQNDFSVKQTVIENVGYNITVQFQNQVVMTSQDPNSLFSVQIAEYDNPFRVNYIGMQKSNVYIQVNMENNCKNKKLILNMNDPVFVDVNNLKQPQKQVKLSDYVVLTQSQIQQAEDTKQIASKSSIFLYILTLLMTILGNSYVLFSTIDLTTFIYFMLFFDVRYPENVLSFCSIFQNFQFAFVPNTIQLYLLEPNYQQPFTPQKFLENGYDAYFFNGAGQSFTIITGISCIYSVIKILSFIPIPQIRVYIQSKIKSGWEYCGFFDLVGCVYVYVLVSALSQFYCFQFDESLAFLNYTMFSLCFTFVMIYPIMLTIFIAKCKNLRDPQIQQQFGSIFGGYVLPEEEQSKEEEKQAIEKAQNDKNNESIICEQQNEENSNKSLENSNPKVLSRQQYLQQKWSKFTNVFLYLRKILYIMILMFLHGQVYFQVIVICLMNLSLSIYYLYLRPQEDKSANTKNGISEIILIFMQSCVCFLVSDDEDADEQYRYNVGWLIIASASTILTIHIFSVIIDLLKGVFNLIKDFIATLLKSRAELKAVKQEKSGEVNQSEFKILGVSSMVSLDKLEKVKRLNKKFNTLIISQFELTQRSSHMKKDKNNQSLIIPQQFEKQDPNSLQQSQQIINNDYTQRERLFSMNDKNLNENYPPQQTKNKSKNLYDDKKSYKSNQSYQQSLHQDQQQQKPQTKKYLNVQSINISNKNLLSPKDTQIQLF
ncbi:H-type lectin domain protein (macronuclear) [Tetrahymena thermophila SB210]|uniref:H-type lectin domain protein n=1 Tax=Tetrahymena thermophila (strain SB210) TaxID=312017 RepID=Q22CP5_TETTS|nr:H-type lectin domain protein [Tetrahymena thermophila SB210]EAR83070.2 H-type lectin domain protein [Tetrahymena thermophila SB210]|eukprot:XP_001030733.2 H-type lectin domain protein [Tetrahymena thermophila SB210]